MESFLRRQYPIVFTVLMVAIAGLSFYVGILEGRQSKGENVILSCSDAVLSSLKIPLETIAKSDTAAVSTPLSSTPQANQPKGKFAGSKNGTKYYTPACSGLSRIKPENIIWFQNAEDATLQGYTPAKC